MADTPRRRNPQHLKKLRRARKGGYETNARAITIPHPVVNVSINGILTTLGLLVAAGILVLFAASAWMQHKEDSARGKAAAALESQWGAGDTLPVVDPATVEIRVLNGCGESGASRDMTTYLRDRRFDVVSAGNADNFNYENTMVVNHSVRPEIGQAVARSLGCNHLTSSPDDMALFDVTVILGRDWSTLVRLSQAETQPSAGTMRQIFTRALSIIGID